MDGAPRRRSLPDHGLPARATSRAGSPCHIAAFTLIEMVLALALLGSLMVALNVFVFSMAEAWGQGSDERLFRQHARAVTRFVDETLYGTLYGPGASGLRVDEVRLPDGGTAVRLLYNVRDAGRLASWPARPLPDVDCSLGVIERRGLVLLWQSRLEDRYDEDPPREAVVSPFVVSIGYDYYDDTFKRWETVEEIRKDTTTSAWELPARIRLRFKRDAMEMETAITLPSKGEGATWY
ncbi:hypothetical protein OPIT5_25385 [Opitutaceae bacterium TAV5]|nr:hypothetical protein OPIT5_25385 [Opitutaceae bacterium TAV5]